MPYTMQGFMTHQDVQETLKDMDLGTTEIQVDDPPAWFVFPESCPVCGAGSDDHESVQVADASGEIFSCLPWDGGRQFLPEPPYEPW